MRTPLLPLLAVVLLSACATFPEIDRAALRYGGAGAAPPLVPLDEVLIGAEPGRASDASRDSLAARATGLRARAGAIRSSQ